MAGTIPKRPRASTEGLICAQDARSDNAAKPIRTAVGRAVSRQLFLMAYAPPSGGG
jgi:hypothetical protein